MEPNPQRGSENFQDTFKERIQSAVQPFSRHRGHHNPRKAIAWGVILIVVGMISILEQVGVLNIRELLGQDFRWRYAWTLFPIVGGLVEIISARHLQEVIQGAILITIGLWLYICMAHLWGWTFQSSWPILVIVVGLGMVVTGFFGPRRSDER